MHDFEVRTNIRTLVIAAAGLALVAIGVLLLMSVSATITGDLPPTEPGDWVIDNPTEVYDEEIYIWDGNITVNSKLTIERSYISVDWWSIPDIYDFKVTKSGSMSVTDSSLASAWGNGVEYIFEGPVYMDASEVMFAWDGIVIKNSNVMISDTNIYRCYNLGIHVVDCSPTLESVYVEVDYGEYVRSFSTDKTYDDDYPLRLACPTAIWVEGGAPSFDTVSVYTQSAARFDIEYTGTQASANMVLWAMAAPVLVESKDVSDVSGITVEYAYSDIHTYLDASDPGPNPQWFDLTMQTMMAGILVWNYEQVAITGVEVQAVYLGWADIRITGLTGSYGYGWWQGPSFKVVAAITETYTTATPSTTSVAFESMDVDDGNYLFMHGYWPSSSAQNPSFSDEVYVKGLSASSYGSPIIMIMMGCDYAGARTLEFYTQITQCTFSNLYGRVLDYQAVAGPGIDPTNHMVDVTETVLVDNCTFSDSSAWQPMLQINGVWANHLADNWDRTVELADNVFTNIGDQLFSVNSIERYAPGFELFQAVNNEFTSCYNNDWNNMFGVYYFDQVRFLTNSFTDCVYPYSGYLWDSGGDANGVKAANWLFEGNTFTGSSAYYERGLIRVEFGGTVTFDGNTYTGGDGLLSVWQYPEYTGTCAVRMTMNEFYENTGPMVYWMRADEDQKVLTVQVDNNTVYNNQASFIDYEWSPDIDTFDNDGLILVMDNDIHDNLAGCIHAWGDVRVINNDFNDNVGPLVTIDHINLHVPTIHGNVMARNTDVYELLAKERGYQLVALKLADVSVDCTGVAFRISNMEVVMERVTIVNAAQPIIAENTYVDMYDSAIDGAGCSVVGEGRITLWWPMEVRVTWGDAEGVDSGKATPNALIVLYDAGNNYYSSSNADENGLLAQQYYGEWRVNLDGLMSFSPYTVKVAASGAAIETTVTVDKALVGNDAFHIVLSDTFKPTVAITDPLEGALVNVNTVKTTGFVAEIGSGMLTLERSLDDGTTWAPLEWDASTGDWTIDMTGLQDGLASLHVRAVDIAGNTATTVVHFSVDTVAPHITIASPTADQLFNAPDIAMRGSVDEDGVKLFVNGMPKPVVAKAFDVALTLNEGDNIIVIEAIDVAGNHASASVQVALDTFAPILVLMGPADGLLTKEGSVVVKGIVEKGATLLVDGSAVVPDADGSFAKLVALDEGSNTIDVKATDAATNERSVTKAVMRDSVAPSVSIVEPEDGIRVTAKSILVRIQADADAVLYLNGRLLPTKGQVDRTILLVEGTNTVTVKAVDLAMNEATDTVTIILDTVAPTLTVTLPAATEVWTNQDTIDVAGVAEDATTVTINGIAAVYSASTGEFSQVVPLVAGENNITVAASDGNNQAFQTLVVWMSKALPVLVVDNPPATVTQPTVTITGHTAIGIKKVAVKVPEGTLYYDVAFDGSFAVKVNLADGQHTIEVSVEDVYGNTNKVSTSAFTVKATSLVEEPEEEGLTVQPMGIGAVIAVVGITIAVVAWLVVRSRRGRHEP